MALSFDGSSIDSFYVGFKYPKPNEKWNMILRGRAELSGTNACQHPGGSHRLTTDHREEADHPK
jgi:hypothetical protein